MPKPENAGKANEAPGQGKMHTVQDAQGNQFEMSQADWKARDKDAGLVRIDEDEADEGAEAPAEG